MDDQVSKSIELADISLQAVSVLMTKAMLLLSATNSSHSIELVSIVTSNVLERLDSQIADVVQVLRALQIERLVAKCDPASDASKFVNDVIEWRDAVLSVFSDPKVVSEWIISKGQKSDLIRVTKAIDALRPSRFGLECNDGS